MFGHTVIGTQNKLLFIMYGQQTFQELETGQEILKMPKNYLVCF